MIISNNFDFDPKTLFHPHDVFYHHANLRKFLMSGICLTMIPRRYVPPVSLSFSLPPCRSGVMSHAAPCYLPSSSLKPPATSQLARAHAAPCFKTPCVHFFHRSSTFRHGRSCYPPPVRVWTRPTSILEEATSCQRQHQSSPFSRLQS
jgi:hypothetical protein